MISRALPCSNGTALPVKVADEYYDNRSQQQPKGDPGTVLKAEYAVKDAEGDSYKHGNKRREQPEALGQVTLQQGYKATLQPAARAFNTEHAFPQAG